MSAESKIRCGWSWKPGSASSSSKGLDILMSGRSGSSWDKGFTLARRCFAGMWEFSHQGSFTSCFALKCFVLRLQTIKTIVDSRSFKSLKSDEPRRVQVLDLYCLTRFECESSNREIVLLKISWRIVYKNVHYIYYTNGAVLWVWLCYESVLRQCYESIVWQWYESKRSESKRQHHDSLLKIRKRHR